MRYGSIYLADVDLKRSVAHLLRDCTNAWSVAVDELLHDQYLRYFEWVALELLFERRVTTPGALAKEVSLNPGTVSRLTGRLSELGLITRIYSLDDRRTVTLEITSKGEKLVLKLAPRFERLQREILQQFSAADAGQLSRLLRKLLTAITARAS